MCGGCISYPLVKNATKTCEAAKKTMGTDKYSESSGEQLVLSFWNWLSEFCVGTGDDLALEYLVAFTTKCALQNSSTHLIIFNSILSHTPYNYAFPFLFGFIAPQGDAMSFEIYSFDSGFS